MFATPLLFLVFTSISSQTIFKFVILNSLLLLVTVNGTSKGEARDGAPVSKSGSVGQNG